VGQSTRYLEATPPISEAAPVSAEEQYRLDLQALEELVVENPDLERLEELLDRFNVFEAVGVVRQELRHSDFLAFLLNPQQPHGLGDLFLKRLLQRTLASNRREALPISLIDLDVWSLDDTLVLREWSNIDLLLVNETHRLVVIIENKIGSGERPNQLVKYRETVHERYPDCRILALYLTPEGDLPSDESYLPVGYALIVDLAEQVLKTRASQLGAEVQVVLRHYVELLRTHVVSNSEIDELCLRIYQKHRRALDLIFERRPDRQSEIQRFLEGMIEETPEFVLDQSGKTLIRFSLEEWDTPELLTASKWTPSGRLLLFWFENKPDRLDLRMEIGPGPTPPRQRLLELALAHAPFRVQTRSLNPRFNRIYKRPFLTGAKLDEAEMEELEREIRKSWEAFLKTDLPVIRQVIRAGGFGIGEAPQHRSEEPAPVLLEPLQERSSDGT
jgi:PD-(D/E)XK nuclease superfamily protein